MFLLIIHFLLFFLIHFTADRIPRSAEEWRTERIGKSHSTIDRPSQEQCQLDETKLPTRFGLASTRLLILIYKYFGVIRLQTNLIETIVEFVI